MTATGPAATLIHTVAGVEWPVAGTWAIRPGPAVEVRRDRRLARRRTATVAEYEGALVVAEHGAGSALRLVVAAVPGLCPTGIDLTAVIAPADPAGRWRIEGTAHAGGHVLAATGSGTYHGVFRSGARAHVWFDLAAVLHDGHPSTPRLALAGQLLALAPDDIAGRG